MQDFSRAKRKRTRPSFHFRLAVFFLHFGLGFSGAVKISDPCLVATLSAGLGAGSPFRPLVPNALLSARGFATFEKNEKREKLKNRVATLALSLTFLLPLELFWASFPVGSGVDLDFAELLPEGPAAGGAAGAPGRPRRHHAVNPRHGGSKTGLKKAHVLISHF